MSKKEILRDVDVLVNPQLLDAIRNRLPDKFSDILAMKLLKMERISFKVLLVYVPFCFDNLEIYLGW